MKRSEAGFIAKTGVQAGNSCEDVCLLGPTIEVFGRNLFCLVFPADPSCKKTLEDWNTYWRHCEDYCK